VHSNLCNRAIDQWFFASSLFRELLLLFRDDRQGPRGGLQTNCDGEDNGVKKDEKKMLLGRKRTKEKRYRAGTWNGVVLYEGEKIDMIPLKEQFNELRTFKAPVRFFDFGLVDDSVIY
jgi:hypothetical protein